jgi:signal transduction protein with GAF and PtsI domain
MRAEQSSWEESGMRIDDEIRRATSDQDALDRIVVRLAADSGTIHFLGSDGLLHLKAATAGMPGPVRAVIARIPIGKGMAGLAVERREPVNACNIQTDNSGDVRPGARATGLAGAIVVPIFRGEEVVGALGVANRSERAFTDTEITELMAAGRALAVRGPAESSAD